MMRRYNLLLVLAALALFVAVAGAVPTTLPATLVGAQNVTLNANGVTGNVAWFTVGTNPSTMPLFTDNVSAPGGAATATVVGTPLYGGYTYYFVACDPTGCDTNAQTFTMLMPTPAPTTTFGASMSNLTSSRFNIFFIASDLLTPLTWATGQYGIVIVTGIFLAFVYLAYWRTGGSTRIPSIMGILSGVFLWSSSSGLNIGMPPEFAMFGEGLLYASIAGLLLSFIKKG